MKLRYSPTSPFVRKVMACAIETGTDQRIEKVPTQTTDPALAKENPLSKVPALITDDGQALYDSPVICEYLDSLPGGGKLFPPAGEARWTTLRQQALADGIMDAVVLIFAENKRVAHEQSPAFLERQRAKIEQGLGRLEAEVGELAGPVTIGPLAVGCALGYVDLRLSEFDWRRRCPKLAKWYAGFAKRRSMVDSAPPAA